MGVPEGGIREFYAGRSVFITGGTGYLGKITVEKLLYSCPEICKLYLMVRAKRGKKAQDRLQELIKSPAFDRLRRDQPNFSEKIFLIAGNMEDEKLGMSEGDISLITSETSVIIHNAATIRFTEPLKKAVHINIVGVRKMLQLAKQMDKLEAFVHVSTAFSNCNKEHIPEALVPQRMTPEQLIQSISWMNDEEMKFLTPRILGSYPNTYTFTKGMAEHLIEAEKGNIPVCIIRPSVILSSAADPVPGWIDGMSGSNGVLILQGLGILRKVHGHNHMLGQVVPADTSANASIVGAWKVAKDKPRSAIILNMTSDRANPITWGELHAYAGKYQHKFPCKDAFRPPVHVVFTSHYWWRQIGKVLDHYLPAIIFDAFSIISGNTPTYFIRAYGLWKFAAAVEYFPCGNWYFVQENMKQFSAEMTPQEKKIFNVDVSAIDWEPFVKDWWMGAKAFVLKDKPSEQPLYDRRMKRLYMRRRVVRYTFVVAVLTGLAYSTKGSSKWPYTDMVLDKIFPVAEMIMPNRLLSS